MQHYVLGFLFSLDGSEVAMIKKNRPDFQAGRWNGIGGKIELNETPLSAMGREFFEETGVKTLTFPLDPMWQAFANLSDPNKNYIITVYRAFDDKVYTVQTVTDEEVMVFPVKKVLRQLPILPSTQYLLPMALDANISFARIGNKE